MDKRKFTVNEKFDSAVDEAYEKLHREYLKGMELHPTRNEASQRANSKDACKVLRKTMHALPDVDIDNSPILFCIERRYREYVERHFVLGETRFEEWYSDDWNAYLREEHHVGDALSAGQRLDPTVVLASKWQILRVMKFLACELAYRRVEAEHVIALNPTVTTDAQAVESDDDENPEAYVPEDHTRRASDSFDRMQCSAAMVTLIFSLTDNSLEDSHHSDEDDPTVNFYGLTVTKFAKLIAQITGLSYDNIRHDIAEWRRGAVSVADKDTRLRKVREAMNSIGVKFNFELLDKAINNSRE